MAQNMSDYDDLDPITRDINTLISSGQSGLLHAVLNTHVLLVDRVDVNERTWMHHAAEHGTWGCLAVLKGHGLDVNAVDVMGETPLHRAIARHHLETVEWLLQEGADPNVLNAYGASPVLYAAGWSADVVTMMVEAGGNPDARDRNGDGIGEWAKTGMLRAAQAALVGRVKPPSP